MDYLKCYQIFAVPLDCTWEELRLAYRRHAQKYHPDRYQQFPDRQSIAEERMLELNKAFDTLGKYYKKNGYLPGTIRDTSSITLSRKFYSEASRHTSSEKPTYVPQVIKLDKLKQAIRKISWLMAIIIAILGYYFILVEENSSRLGNIFSTSPSDKIDYRNHNTITDGFFSTTLQHLTQNETDKDHADHRLSEIKGEIYDSPFFTHGDTPGRVFEVQGVPTRTVGDIWFYGKSEVHFNKGEVVSWYSSATHPLKVK